MALLDVLVRLVLEVDGMLCNTHLRRSTLNLGQSRLRLANNIRALLVDFGSQPVDFFE